MKKFFALALAAGVLAGCQSEADIASYNVSKSADMFEVTRKITFINGITNEAMLTIEGLCSLGNSDKEEKLSVTCKTGPGEYKKHFLGLSDNVTFVSEQIEPVTVSRFHYRVIFNPSTLIPAVELQK